MSSDVQVNGVAACEEAFERLKSGRSRLPAHVGLDPAKITAGIVSVEAGYDRGYLKKARRPHQELIARIEAFRTRSHATSNSQQIRMKRAMVKSELALQSLESTKEKLYQVLSQNLRLVERIRALENELRELRAGAARDTYGTSKHRHI